MDFGEESNNPFAEKSVFDIGEGGGGGQHQYKDHGDDLLTSSGIIGHASAQHGRHDEIDHYINQHHPHSHTHHGFDEGSNILSGFSTEDSHGHGHGQGNGSFKSNTRSATASAATRAIGSEDEEEEEEEEEDHSLSDYSTLGLPILNTTRQNNAGGTKPIEIISTDTINGVVYYIIKANSYNNNSNNNNMIKRRYSDFQTLRISLIKFFPTKIIPIIPEKHSWKDYINGQKQVRNNLIVDFRKRKFTTFLNRLWIDPVIRNSIIFQKFVNPNEEIWSEVLKIAPFTLLPTNILLASPQNPTEPSPYYSYLPIPPMQALKHFDSDLNKQVFVPLEQTFHDYKRQLHSMESIVKKIITNLKQLTMKKVELGANFNVFSLIDNNVLTEKIGQAVDLEFINLEILIKNIIVDFKEPLQDLKNQCNVALQILQFRKFKELQLYALTNIILKKQSRTSKLIQTENLHLKLDAALKHGSEESPTIAAAVRRLQAERKTKMRTLSEEEEELLNNSAILNASSSTSSPTSTITRTQQQQNKRSLFNLFGGKTKDAASMQSQDQYQQQRASASQPVAAVPYIETKDIQIMSSQERLNELTYNRQELNKLHNCFQALSQDSKFLNIEIEKNCHLELINCKFEMFNICKKFESILLVYCKEANHWPK